MRQFFIMSLALAGLLFAGSCGSSSTASKGNPDIQSDLDNRNSAVIPLITRIRRLPGIGMENGVPVFIKSQNALQGGASREPLYVLDGLILGTSYRQVRDAVQPVDVASIKAVTGADASFYGARGANGVILITTKKGD